MERFLRLAERDAVVAGRIDGLERQRDAPLRVHVEARDRCGGELLVRVPAERSAALGSTGRPRSPSARSRRAAAAVSTPTSARSRDRDRRSTDASRRPRSSSAAVPPSRCSALVFRNSRSSEPTARSVLSTQAAAWSSRAPAEQEAPIALGRPPFRAGLRDLSLQPQTFSRPVDPVRGADSTSRAGPRARSRPSALASDGSRSNVRRRWRPNASRTASTASASTSSASRLRPGRRGAACPRRPSPSVTSRRSTCRIARRPSAPLASNRRSARARTRRRRRRSPRRARAQSRHPRAARTARSGRTAAGGALPAGSHTSATISATVQARGGTPTRSAGPRIACSSSSGVSGGTVLGPGAEQLCRSAGTRAAGRRSPRAASRSPESTRRVDRWRPATTRGRLPLAVVRVNVNTSSNWSTTRTALVSGGRRVARPPRAGPAIRSRAGRGASGSAAPPRRRIASSSSSIGCAPGRARNTATSASPSAPARIAGTSPARTTDDFPLPLGPTTDEEPGSGTPSFGQPGEQSDRAPRDRRSRRRRLPRRAAIPYTGCGHPFRLRAASPDDGRPGCSASTSAAAGRAVTGFEPRPDLGEVPTNRRAIASSCSRSLLDLAGAPTPIRKSPRYALASASNTTFDVRTFPWATSCRCANASADATCRTMVGSSLPVERFAPFLERAKAAAPHVARDQVRPVRLPPVVEERDDVRVLERRDGLRFRLEPTNERTVARRAGDAGPSRQRRVPPEAGAPGTRRPPALRRSSPSGDTRGGVRRGGRARHPGRGSVHAAARVPVKDRCRARLRGPPAPAGTQTAHPPAVLRDTAPTSAVPRVVRGGDDGEERLRLSHRSPGLAARQQTLDPFLLGGEPQVIEPRRFGEEG